jgi:hypothetical protein
VLGDRVGELVIGSFCSVESQVGRTDLDHIPVGQRHLAKRRATIHQRPAGRAEILDRVPARSPDERCVVVDYPFTGEQKPGRRGLAKWRRVTSEEELPTCTVTIDDRNPGISQQDLDESNHAPNRDPDRDESNRPGGHASTPSKSARQSSEQ